MTNSNTLTLGCDLDLWDSRGAKIPITVDLSPSTNSHILICGLSGGGKSFAEQSIAAKLVLASPDNELYFADYKGDDSFHYLRDCPRYYAYKNTLSALDTVHARLNARLSGEDESRHTVTLIWDEYMANILALTNEDKKLATAEMNKVSEILLMGRSMSVRLIMSMQRPDMIAFPAGSRLNYGVVIILGAARSIYEMLMPDHMELVKGRQFERGEGVCLLQGSELRFIKVPTVQNVARMQQILVDALTR
jgi:DNA helicase HerA-like ATPase